MPFLGLTIYLDSRPLIPRPETEWWVEQLIEGIRPAVGPNVLDLCAGSGAIGCALMRAFPAARVSFGEIDPAHEATIKKNIRENGLDEGRADIRIGDLFAPFAGERFDIIAANPPYVPEGRELPSEVADYEPPLALRAGADGLAVLRRIAEGFSAHLSPGGVAWVECDAPSAEAARQLFIDQGPMAEIKHDQYDRPRIIVISSNQ